MKTAANLMAGFALALLVSAPVLAQEIQSHVASQIAPAAQPEQHAGGLSMGKHDSKAPIDVNADAFEGDYNTKVGTYTGNVIVTQTDYKLRADKVNVNIVDGKPNKIFAHGNIVLNTTSGTATGDEGVYDLNDPPTVTLTGKVVLVKEKNVMRGTHLVVDVDTGIAHLTAPGGQGGRVHGLLYPHQATDSGKPKPSSSDKVPRTN